VYCWSYICNNISCLVWFLFCTFHILAIFLCFNSLEVLPEGSLRHRCKLQKRRHHSTFLPTLCLLFSHLAHSDEDPNNHLRKRLKTPHRSTKVEDRLPTSITMFLFISLLLASSFFESRDEIPFKGVDLSHPEISNLRM
jgi:hypothetical protein